jgi:hypothetical protein
VSDPIWGSRARLVADCGRTALQYAPKLTPAELGDFSGAAGAAVASLHAEYLAIGVQREALASLPGWATLTTAALRQAST